MFVLYNQNIHFPKTIWYIFIIVTSPTQAVMDIRCGLED